MRTFLAYLSILTSFAASAQSIEINPNGGTNSSAILDLKSTTKGFLLPRMTNAQMRAIPSPAQGLLTFCTDCGTNGDYYFYKGTAWVILSSTTVTSFTSIGAVSDVASSQGATVTSDGVLNLAPADATNPGIVTKTAQTFAGVKTFSNGIVGNVTGNVSGNVTGNASTATTATTATSVSGTVAIANGGTGATTASGALTNLGAAPIASPTFTGTVNGIDKTMVGLANVDNTTDLLKPISTATSTALANKVDKVSGKDLSTNDYTTTEKTKLAAITGTNTGDQDLTGKVDKVTGKGLSTNDYTTTEQTKLAAISGTNTGDETAASIKTKLGVTTLSGSNTGDQDLSSYATSTALANKVDKVSGKDLSTNDYTTTEKTKLAAITGTNTGDQDLTGKVDKVTGKGLSTNDYTTTEQTKLAAISGTNTGDETEASIKTKLGVTTLSGSNTGDQDLSSYATSTALTNKVDKVTGKSLLSDTEITRLTAITGTNTGDQTTITGNAGTATKLAATKNINGVAFDGSADVTVTAAAETLSGTTLKSTVTGSSLTSVGTLVALEVNGAATNTTAHNAASSSTIDFTKSNLAYSSNNPSSFTLSGIKDGGTYTLAVQGTTSGTSTFSSSGFTFKSVNNGSTTSGKQTLYTFIVMGTTVYCFMAAGF